MKNDLKLIKKDGKAKENRLLTVKRLGDFIENHSACKELSVFCTSYLMPFSQANKSLSSSF